MAIIFNSHAGLFIRPLIPESALDVVDRHLLLSMGFDVDPKPIRRPGSTSPADRHLHLAVVGDDVACSIGDGDRLQRPLVAVFGFVDHTPSEVSDITDCLEGRFGEGVREIDNTATPYWARALYAGANEAKDEIEIDLGSSPLEILSDLLNKPAMVEAGISRLDVMVSRLQHSKAGVVEPYNAYGVVTPYGQGLAESHALRAIAENSIESSPTGTGQLDPVAARENLLDAAQVVLSEASREGCEEDLAVVEKDVIASLEQASERCAASGGALDLANGARALIESADDAGCEDPSVTVVRTGALAEAVACHTSAAPDMDPSPSPRGPF